MSCQVAIYARVSSEQQATAGTIQSQISALQERVAADGCTLHDELRFVDDGFSGSTLVRPALERLRDMAAAGAVDRVYVHSPDRLVRNYAHQVVLIEELMRAGVEVVFLNRALGKTPEDDLLLQVQGMMSEYERKKIMERSRRGKLHAAKAGSVNVLSCAPYGYRYLTKYEGGGRAQMELVPEQVEIVKQIFEWIGRDRLSIGEVCRRLVAQGVPTAKGKGVWDRTHVWAMLRNPAYKGTAAFGKTRQGPMRKRLNPGRGQSEQPRRAHSIYDVPSEEWHLVPVPAIVTPELFESAQEQLKENREQARVRRHGATYLLQGLVKCKQCGYSLYGKPVSIKSSKGKRRDYAYYRCIGTDAFRFQGTRICQTKQIRTDKLDEVVWAAAQDVMAHPQRLETEYRRRLQGSTQNEDDAQAHLQGEMAKVRRSIARLIDSYTEGLLEKAEFEPRIKGQKQRLAALEVSEKQIADAAQLKQELRAVLEQLEGFAARIKDGLDTADWHTRRDLIRTLVKRVEIDHDEVHIVFRIGSLPSPAGGSDGQILQHCGRGDDAALGSPRKHRRFPAILQHSRLQPEPQQLQHPTIRDSPRHALQKEFVIDAPEVIPNISIKHMIEPLCPQLSQGFQGLHGPTLRTESVGMLPEICLEQRFDHELGRHLDDPIPYRWNAQRTLLTIRLGDVSPQHRLRSILACPQVVLDAFQEGFHALLLDARDRLMIDSRRTFVPSYTLPGFPQDVTPVDAVIQSVESSPRSTLGPSPQTALKLSHFVR